MTFSAVDTMELRVVREEPIAPKILRASSYFVHLINFPYYDHSNVSDFMNFVITALKVIILLRLNFTMNQFLRFFVL